MLAAQAIDDEQRRDLADARLDRLQRDEVGIELREHALDVAGDGRLGYERAHAPRPPLPVAVPAAPYRRPEGASVA